MRKIAIWFYEKHLTSLGKYKNLSQNKGKVQKINNVTFCWGSERSLRSLSHVSRKACNLLYPQNIVLELSERPSFHPALFSVLHQRRQLSRKVGCAHLMDVPYYWPKEKEMTTTSSCQWHIAGTWSKAISQRSGYFLI